MEDGYHQELDSNDPIPIDKKLHSIYLVTQSRLTAAFSADKDQVYTRPNYGTGRDGFQTGYRQQIQHPHVDGPPYGLLPSGTLQEMYFSAVQ
ncbi:hypothetical protein SAMD00023353_2801110 [Rosellinia necatrix]|uniref:Uncharacterized protein n=1 Tax=Rosellinia necatrix TaxID=77044 RepID=A0A1S8A8J0_ROSNE|nr:hypothetical protein SAMD00023353_2801110 [Rosellinia necatrix]